VTNYLKMAKKQQIEALLELGWSYREIERETGVRRETIARYDSKRISKPAKVPTGSPDQGRFGPESQAEPYRKSIFEGLEKGLTAQRIWQDLVEECAYSGSYDSIKRYCRRLKKSHPEVADVMSAPPGKESQIDFFKGPPTFNPKTGRYGRPWIFRMTLCCSRHGYEEATWTQELPTFLKLQENAFKDLGGVTEVVRLDNLRAGVERACLYDPDINTVYAAFAQHYGFVPLPCRPYKAQEKGKVERSGGYVLENALKGKRFESLEELNAYLKHWNRTIARQRIHGTTKKQVWAHFVEVERPTLKPLPDRPFSFFQVGRRVVHPDGHVQVQGAFYSVPHLYVGQEVEVHYDEHLVRVLDGEKTIAVHGRVEAGTFKTRSEHRPAHKPAQEEVYEARLLLKTERIGPRAKTWAEAAIKERGVRSYRLLQGVISLTRSHPKERIDWACAVALEKFCFRYQAVKRLAEEAQRKAEAPPKLLEVHPVIRPLKEYT